MGQPRQHETYTWFIAEFANLRTAFRWATDQGDLDVAATMATYAGFLGYLVENHEPIAWAEELIEPARAVEHPRLAFLYAIASLCWVAGRIEAAVGYSDAGQTVLGSGRDEVLYGLAGLVGVRTCTSASSKGRSKCSAPTSHAVATLTYSPGQPWSSR